MVCGPAAVVHNGPLLLVTGVIVRAGDVMELSECCSKEDTAAAEEVVKAGREASTELDEAKSAD